jgi:hypothetical protein
MRNWLCRGGHLPVLTGLDDDGRGLSGHTSEETEAQAQADGSNALSAHGYKTSSHGKIVDPQVGLLG